MKYNITVKVLDPVRTDLRNENGDIGKVLNFIHNDSCFCSGRWFSEPESVAVSFMKCATLIGSKDPAINMYAYPGNHEIVFEDNEWFHWLIKNGFIYTNEKTGKLGFFLSYSISYVTELRMEQAT